MSAKEKLLQALFENEKREHINLKFLRGTRTDVSVDEICEQSLNAIEQVDSGKVERRTSFGDAAK